MADAAIAVTEGSGKNVHTNSVVISATTYQDQYTVAGEYVRATYTAIADNISVATANDHVLQLMAGSTNNLRIRRIRVHQRSNASAAATCSFSILRLTTAGTGGTSVTPAKFNTGDAAAGATAMTLPSSKGTESTLLLPFVLSMRATANVGVKEDEFEWVQQLNEEPLMVLAGTSNGLAIKTLTAVTSATVNAVIEFVETSF